MAFYWNEFIKEVNKDLEDGFTVLDAGAGDGHWRGNLKKDIRYISMDMGVGDATVDYSSNEIKGDLRNIPLENNSIDRIICIQVLEHLPEPWIVLKEFNRVLKPGGIIFLSLPHGVPIHQEPYDFYRYTKYGITYLLNQASFEIKFLIPQLGDSYKMANDLRMTGNDLLSKKARIGYVYKLLARFLERFLQPLDEKYQLYNSTTGYFIKAQKL